MDTTSPANAGLVVYEMLNERKDGRVPLPNYKTTSMRAARIPRLSHLKAKGDGYPPSPKEKPTPHPKAARHPLYWLKSTLTLPLVALTVR